MFKEQLLSRQERQALVNEVTENVLSRISVTVDTDDIIQKVRGVQQEIDRLTQ